MTIKEQIFDKDHHNIGEIKLVDDNKYVTIEINGQYWHHFIKTRYKSHGGIPLAEYIFTEKKGEYPVIVLHPTDENRREEVLKKWTKITKFQLGQSISGLEDVNITGEDVIVEPPPDMDVKTKRNYELLRYWVEIARKHHNIWIHLYDENGKEIGSIEEGLDFFTQIMLYTKICPQIKIWHYPVEGLTQVFGKVLHPEITLDLAFVKPEDNGRGDEDYRNTS